MALNKWVLIGGGVATLVVGALVLSRGASGGEAAAPVTDIGSYYPPIVSGGGYSGIDPGGLNQSGNYSTDTSIASIIASNLSIAQLQSSTTLETARIEKDVALAGYASDLALQKDKSATTLSLQSLVNSGAEQLAKVTGANAQVLAKITGANEQAMASITGTNALNLQKTTDAGKLALVKQTGRNEQTLKSLSLLGKSGGKVNLPGKGGILTVKAA